jgi:5-(carboxyamino)imidazole ribonucleotide mutase
VTDGKLSKNDTPVVAILTGSPSDLPIVLKGRDVLESLDVPCDVRVLSAHRTPAETAQYIAAAERKGVLVFIACAGMAAHLAGAVAAHTLRPVIGVPIASGALQGVDALLSTVQMPPGVPVATVGVDGAENAGFLAARVVALAHPEVEQRIRAHLEESKKRYDSPDPSVPGQATT